jgi:hypothetical protein
MCQVGTVEKMPWSTLSDELGKEDGGKRRFGGCLTGWRVSFHMDTMVLLK